MKPDRHSRLHRPAFWLAALLWLLAASGVCAQSAVLADPGRVVDLLRGGHLYEADGSTPPGDLQRLDGWLAGLKRTSRVSLFGGSYWLHAVVRNESSVSQWIIDPHGSLIEQIDVRVQVPGHPVRQFASGYQADPEFMLHYGGVVTLPPGADAQVLVHLESRYFARYPSVDLVEEASYRKTVVSENVLALSALGALVTLAFYNLFMFYGTRDKALLYYSLYLLAATAGWGLTFHIGAQWLGFHELQWHYVGFFLLPVFNTLFYLEFLQLKRLAPKLSMASLGVIALSLALLP